MKKEELAVLLNGREYRNEITKEQEQLAKDNGLAVVFGYSDDNMEIRGAIYNEYGCYNGGKISFNKTGDEIKSGKNSITAVWSPKTPDCSWIYKTKIPHANFNILEDGELYCVGMVFSVDDLV